MSEPDIECLQKWWRAQLPEQDPDGSSAIGVQSLSQLSGGAIQENWRVQTDQGEYVLRTDAASGVSVSASRATEYHVLKAMHAAGVQVPEPMVVCEDASVIGKPFFIMRCVTGSTHPVHLTAKSKLADTEKATLVKSLGQQLARIHAVPSDSLSALSVPVVDAPAMEFRVAQYRGLLKDLGMHRPVLEWAFNWLLKHDIPTTRQTVCHSDYRTGNLMIDGEALTGILDWEFTSISDPHEDIGWLCAPCWRFGRRDLEAGGLGEREDFYQGYESESGHAIDQKLIPYWEVLAIVRWAVIALQQGARFTSGAEPELELGLTGRMIAELEWDVLVHMATLDSEVNDAMVTVRERFVGRGGGLAALPRPLKPDEPRGDALLDAARKLLLDEVLPVVPKDYRYRVLMIGNAMGIAGRELGEGVRDGDGSVGGDELGLEVVVEDALGRVGVGKPGVVGKWVG